MSIRRLLNDRKVKASLVLLWITALWWLFVWRYLSPVPADRLMLALGDFTHTYYVFRDLAYR
ncbi:hypothetical protein, partial [Thermoflexus hugenholtzii]